MNDQQQDVHDRDSVSAELESMRQIARALDLLRDADARQRVLQWAHDRYGVVVAAAPAEVMRVADAPVVSEGNAVVEELQDLFEPRQTDPSAQPRASATRPRGVDSMIKDFAADFRRFALEWQSA